MLVVAIEVKQQFGNGLQPLSEFGDDPHLLSTVRFYRYFFGEQLRKLLQMAMGDAVDVRFERRLAGGYGGGGIMSVRARLRFGLLYSCLAFSTVIDSVSAISSWL